MGFVRSDLDNLRCSGNQTRAKTSTQTWRGGGAALDKPLETVVEELALGALDSASSSSGFLGLGRGLSVLASSVDVGVTKAGGGEEAEGIGLESLSFSSLLFSLAPSFFSSLTFVLPLSFFLMLLSMPFMAAGKSWP